METSRLLNVTTPFCTGYGVDIGCELDAHPNARVVVDGQAHVYAHYVETRKPHIRDINNYFPDWDAMSFDFVYSSHCLEHLHDPWAFLTEAHRLLKVGGNLVLVLPHEDWYWPRTHPQANPDHRWWDLSPRKVGKWIRACGNFELTHISEHGRGEGNWSFVMVAKKMAPGATPVDRFMFPPEFQATGVPLPAVAVADTKPPVSIVIPVWGGREMTQTCVESIFADMPDAEVIIVDNASPDDTREWMESEPRIKTVYLDTNYGISIGWNRGLDLATSDLLGLWGNDCTVIPGGLHRYIETAKAYDLCCSEAAAIGEDMNGLYWTESNDPAAICPCGSSIIKREVMDSVGRMDEVLPLGCYNDIDWAFRAIQKGYRFRVAAGNIVHARSQTFARLPKEEHQQALEGAYAILKDRWQEWWTAHRNEV